MADFSFHGSQHDKDVVYSEQISPERITVQVKNIIKEEDTYSSRSASSECNGRAVPLDSLTAG